MDKQDRIQTDLLKKYMNPGYAEKTPEGFTAKTMTRIQLEAGSMKVPVRSLFSRKISAISIVITFTLMMASFALSSNDYNQTPSFLNKVSQRVDISIPNIDLTTYFNLSFPSWMPWLLVAVIILSFFDRALLMYFHKGEK
jgi:hypothetical protein